MSRGQGMSDYASSRNDQVPGRQHPGSGAEPDGAQPRVDSVRSYLIGLALAVLLTAGSFWAANTNLIYGPAVPVALVALAIAQMGIHLVFFLHITTSPDNVNNVLALAFGVLIVCLVVFGSLWIMSHLNQNMMPATLMLHMQG